MDGNGRWAERRGMGRAAGHRAGATAVERIVAAAPASNITVLTLFAFSSDNWRRPLPEVTGLLRLFGRFLRGERGRAVANGVAVTVIGKRERLPEWLCADIEATEAATASGRRLALRLAVDYSARDEILRAAAGLATTPANMTRERFAELLSGGVPPVDLLIRTGGEYRLSDFLLWECAYAELFFSPTMWPDFTPAELQRIVTEFRGRDRRFGGVSAEPAPLQLSR
jgi:undecaprenyl diphosphate synthase